MDHDGPLLTRARLLVADGDLMNGTLEGKELDAAVKAKAQRILAGSRQSVTSLQARAGQMGEHEERRYWRGIVRPIPSIASPAASAGTRFHAWAERFVDAAIPGAFEGAGPEGGAGASAPVTREELLADLARRERAMAGAGSGGVSGAAGVSGPTGASNPTGVSSPADVPDVSGTSSTSDTAEERVERDLLLWQRRLAESVWAGRTPVWAERQLVVALPQLDGIIANGKLDAVFAGGVDPNDTSKRFTVVDWKTGRRPRNGRQAAEKLVQLDLYRLLLATMENVPLDSIDAVLYYVSEPDESRRQLRAGAKTEQDIIAELSSGVPEQSDDD